MFSAFSQVCVYILIGKFINYFFYSSCVSSYGVRTTEPTNASYMYACALIARKSETGYDSSLYIEEAACVLRRDFLKTHEDKRYKKYPSIEKNHMNYRWGIVDDPIDHDAREGKEEKEKIIMIIISVRFNEIHKKFSITTAFMYYRYRNYIPNSFLNKIYTFGNLINTI